jgi:hypothetical protein
LTALAHLRHKCKALVLAMRRQVEIASAKLAVLLRAGRGNHVVFVS